MQSKITYEIVMKASLWILVSDQVRTQATAAEDANLVESVRRYGILQPLGVLPDGKLCWGHRRLRAARTAGLTEVPVVVLDGAMTEGEFRALQLTENFQRVDLSALEQVHGVAEFARLSPQLSNKEIAASLQIDAGMVTRYRTVAASPLALAGLTDGSLTGISDAYEIAKAPADQQPRLLQLRQSGANRDALVRQSRSRPRSNAPKAARLVCLLPSGYTVTVSGGGVSLEDATDALADAIKEMKRARYLGYTAKTFAAAMADKSRKG